MIIEALDKDRKASDRNVVRNFNKDLLQNMSFYMIYYYFLISGNIKTLY